MSILDSQGKGKGKATGSDFLALDLGVEPEGKCGGG
jgi:hypothetical protein